MSKPLFGLPVLIIQLADLIFRRNATVFRRTHEVRQLHIRHPFVGLHGEFILCVGVVFVRSHAQIFHFVARFFGKLSVAVALVNQIHRRGTPFVSGYFPQIFRLVRVICLFVIMPTERDQGIDITEVGADFKELQVFLRHFSFGHFAQGLPRQKQNFRRRTHHFIADRFEFLVLLKRNFLRHDIGIGAIYLALTAIPQVI